MLTPSGVITLLTDFGTRDAYAGTMKGAILSVNPRAQIVDLSHTVTPQDVVEAAWLLRTAFRYFPAGTVHVAVVDPEVGSERRAIAVRASNWYFVAPDNGVLSWAIGSVVEQEVVALTNPNYFLPEMSSTFHGRDVFAPVAAHLSAGVPFDELGPRISDPVTLPIPPPRVGGVGIVAQVVHVDRFGNLITNLDFATFSQWHAQQPTLPLIEVAGKRIEGIRPTYSAAAPYTLLALFESSGYLEIALRDGSAAEALGVGRGGLVEVRRG